MNTERGQTLIELLISIVVVGIVLTAVTYTAINSLKNAQSADNQTAATQYAQAGLEIVRNMRYTDYTTFNALNGNYCLADGCSAVSTQNNNVCGPVGSQCSTKPNIPSSNPTFIRQVAVTQNAAACSGPTPLTQSGTQVVISVAWTDAQCTAGSYCHQATNTACITTYDQIPTP